MRRRLADERGQASAELMGMMVWLLLVTLIVWQVCLAAWTYTQVSNAARTASRVEARGGRPEEGRPQRALGPLRKNIEKIKIEGERATVEVRMPIVMPGVFSSKDLLASASGAPGSGPSDDPTHSDGRSRRLATSSSGQGLRPGTLPASCQASACIPTEHARTRRRNH